MANPVPDRSTNRNLRNIEVGLGHRVTEEEGLRRGWQFRGPFSGTIVGGISDMHGNYPKKEKKSRR